jgi:hypothetical protein
MQRRHQFQEVDTIFSSGGTLIQSSARNFGLMKIRQLGDVRRVPDQKAASTTKPSEHHRFNLQFSRFFAFTSLVTILTVFLGEVLGAFLSRQTKEPIFFLALMIVLPLLTNLVTTHFLIRKFHFIITPKEILGFDSWGSPKCLSWQEITSVKLDKVIGVRNLVIQRSNAESIYLPSYFHDLSKILNCVRQYASADHPLALALEKEISRPQQRPHRMAWRMIMAIVLLISTWLIGGNLLANQLGKPLTQAIINYQIRYATVAPNDSAVQLQALMTKLGLSVEYFHDGNQVKTQPTKAAVNEWKAIDKILDKYLRQNSTKFKGNQGSQEVLPKKLADFLAKHQPDLEAINNHLVKNSIPQWGKSTKNDKLNYKALDNIQSLDIANMIGKFGNSSQGTNQDLEALNKLNQSLQRSLSLKSQYASRRGERRIAKLVLIKKEILNTWGNNLFQSTRYQQMHDLIQDMSTDISAVLQKPAELEEIFNDLKLSFWPLRYHHLISPYLRIAAVDYYDKSQQRLSYWTQQNICHINENPSTSNSLLISKALPSSKWNDLLEDHNREYTLVAISDLYWELTNGVRQIRSQLAMGKTDTEIVGEFIRPSKICSGEQWVAKAENGFITLSLSRPFNWQALGIDPSKDSGFEPLTYTVSL